MPPFCKIGACPISVSDRHAKSRACRQLILLLSRHTSELKRTFLRKLPEKYDYTCSARFSCFSLTRSVIALEKKKSKTKGVSAIFYGVYLDKFP